MGDYHHHHHHRHHGNFSIGNNFYEHYLQQHAIMTRYFQGLLQSCSPNNSWSSYRAHPYNACHCRPVNSQARGTRYRHHSSPETSSESYLSSESSSSSSSDYELEEEDDYKSHRDDSESECEYELNVDAIIAMRAAKEELNDKPPTSESDSSIVIVESDKEEFEFLNSESMVSLSVRLSQGVGGTNRNAEIKTQKKIMEELYGEKSSTIAGLETAMYLSFERLYDIHQPSLWPVLPVRL